MLVGQSGPHHFSAVFSFRIEPGSSAVTVEVADRCLAPLQALASTFLVDLPSGNLADAGPSKVLWSLASPPGTLALAAGDGSQIALAEAGRRATRAQAHATVDPGRSTQHYVYQWRWAPSAS
jgi:hypothetical protein